MKRENKTKYKRGQETAIIIQPRAPLRVLDREHHIVVYEVRYLWGDNRSPELPLRLRMTCDWTWISSLCSERNRCCWVISSQITREREKRVVRANIAMIARRHIVVYEVCYLWGDYRSPELPLRLRMTCIDLISSLFREKSLLLTSTDGQHRKRSLERKREACGSSNIAIIASATLLFMKYVIFGAIIDRQSCRLITDDLRLTWISLFVQREIAVAGDFVTNTVTFLDINGRTTPKA
ncbi:hypothetical protein J6590_039957 [Homalodisca vitripennis]|nr:hypothetical protein J6590_039957 [Homalodisca vitripennis]